MPESNHGDHEYSTKNVMVVYGTRPEAIKVAPVIKAIEAHPLLRATTVVTGQHREMLDQVNKVFSIVPDKDLDLFEPGQTLNTLSSKIFSKMDELLAEAKPDALIVQGDTTTVMAAAVAGFYREVPIIHLEAGLRSHNIFSPFPEEANRKIVSQVSSLHIAPTEVSKANLLAESVAPERIVVTGNTVIDALLHAAQQDVQISDPRVQAAVDSGRRILLVTTHRRENWGNAMVEVGKALHEIAHRYPDDLIVFPTHRNPIVRKAVLPEIEGLDNVITCEPLPYQEFAFLISKVHMVVTDSGGVQEEAPTLGKPVLVLRENTERPEAVIAGTVKLIGTDKDRVVAEVAALKDDAALFEGMSRAINPYGDGAASERTVAAILQMFGLGERMPDFTP